MGSSRGWYKNTSLGDSMYKWIAVGNIHGVKVLKNKTDDHAPLPTFSKTPNTKYLRQAPSGGIDQMRIFIGRHSFYDIDWGHNHGSFPKGTAHVQKWEYNPKTGTVTRVKGSPSYVSEYMIKKYGKIIKAADPNVKWR